MTPSPYDNPDWLALLRAVVASPADDLPRLVAADWLEENDEALRAEFIRIQCELARMENLSSEKAEQLRLREKEMMNSPIGVSAWALESCPEFVHFRFKNDTVEYSDVNRVTFHRGFPWHLHCEAQEWMRHGSIVNRQPIKQVTLSQCDSLSMEQWWHMIPLLNKLQRIVVDSRWASLPRMLRQVLPGIEVLPYR